MGLLSGSFINGFWVRLGFPLMSKSNFRRSVNASTRSSWSKYSSFEASASKVILSARPLAWDVSAISVPLPKRPVVVSVIVARSVLDAANYSKSVLDAAQGVLFVSDASVAGVTSLGVRARADQDAVLGFAQLPPGSSLEVVNLALSELSLEVFPLLA
jgi:hypothetical protein